VLGLVVMAAALPPSHGSPIRWAENHCWPPQPTLPAYYATTMTLVAAIGVLLMRETAFQPLDASSPQADEVARP
jgi:hypothetical protein